MCSSGNAVCESFSFSDIPIVEKQINSKSKQPADRPRHPYTVRAEKGREDISKNHTKYKIKAGAYHKGRHNAAASKSAVYYYLYADEDENPLSEVQ